MYTCMCCEVVFAGAEAGAEAEAAHAHAGSDAASEVLDEGSAQSQLSNSCEHCGQVEKVKLTSTSFYHGTASATDVKSVLWLVNRQYIC